MNKEQIAPCGMNCGVCLHFLRAANKCPGCRSGRKVNDRPVKCGRYFCRHRTGEFCFECDKFPCASIKKLDERYRKRYGMSEIENLEYIRNHGIEKFLKWQGEKYIFQKKIFCVHDKNYYEII